MKCRARFKNTFRTILFASLVYLLAIDFSYNLALAAPEHIVFGVKTEIMMQDQDEPRRDFYVNIGTSQGVKAGSVLDVFRSVTSSDNINNRSARNIIFKIAKLKIIHADEDIAVGRIIEMFSGAETPIGEYTSVIVGDRVAITTR